MQGDHHIVEDSKRTFVMGRPVDRHSGTIGRFHQASNIGSFVFRHEGDRLRRYELSNYADIRRPGCICEYLRAHDGPLVI